MVYTCAIAAIAPAHVITDTMRQSVIGVKADASSRSLLDRKKKPIVALCSAISNNSEPSDLLRVGGVCQTQNTPVLSIGDRRTWATRIDFESGNGSVVQA